MSEGGEGAVACRGRNLTWRVLDASHNSTGDCYRIRGEKEKEKDTYIYMFVYIA